MIKSLFNFNLHIKGGIFLFRHFLYTLFPLIIVSSLQLEVNSPIKWLVVLPFMYLMAVNDYNRLFTLFKNPLPIFMITVLVSVVCGVFPKELFWFSRVAFLFRIMLAFNIGNKATENPKNPLNQKSLNMKSFFKKNRVIILTVNFILAYFLFLFLNGHLRIVDQNFNYQLNNLFYFIGGNIFFVGYFIFKIVKKEQLDYLPFLLLLWLSMFFLHMEFILPEYY